MKVTHNEWSKPGDEDRPTCQRCKKQTAWVRRMILSDESLFEVAYCRTHRELRDLADARGMTIPQFEASITKDETKALLTQAKRARKAARIAAKEQQARLAELKEGK